MKETIPDESPCSQALAEAVSVAKAVVAGQSTPIDGARFLEQVIAWDGRSWA